MRSDKFQNALGMVDRELVKRANGTPRVNRYFYRRLTVTVAAVLALTLLIASVGWIGSRDEGWSNVTHNSSDGVTDATFAPVISPPSWWTDVGNKEIYDPRVIEKYLLFAAEYPAMTKYPDKKWDPVTSGYTAEYMSWKSDRERQLSYAGAGKGLGEFFEKSVREFLLGRGTGNSVYSPLNVYFSIAMMAELAAEEERTPIFSLLGVDSIEELRSQANSVWNANYCDDGMVKSVLANSVWTDKDLTYDEKLLNVFRESHKASVFEGDFGSDEYNFALRSWINDNTDGLVDRLSDVSLDPSTVLALVSTISFSAKWKDEFNKNRTESGTFHSPIADVSCDFMNDKSLMDYYRGKGFSAVKKELVEAGSVCFVLPDEDVSIDTMLYNANVTSILSDADGWSESKCVELSVPKFEIQSDMDLIEGLERLGVRVSEIDGIRHGAGVSMDEEGAKASAFTVDSISGLLPPDEIVFALDRPFMFIITGIDGLPLFVGIVNQP